MGIYKKLLEVQRELKAPKNQKNTFGGYNYRSCEDILEAVKPLLVKNNLSLQISDELENIGERYYIKATATLLDTEDDSTMSNTAYAREEEVKKGMDGSQITGTASSYARKYALNGLFLIDDTKDADTDAYTKLTNVKDKATASQIKTIRTLVKDIPAVCNYYKIEKLEDITKEDAEDLIRRKSK